MTKKNDGWLEVPIVHESIMRTRFENNLLRLRGTKKMRVELQQLNLSCFPLSSFQSASTRFEVLPGAS